MSRHRKIVTPSITIWYGEDHAIGKWLDITDERFAMSGKDEQGEGYVFEWSEKFPKGTNLINYQLPKGFKLTDDGEDSQFMADIIIKCNAFISYLYNEN